MRRAIRQHKGRSDRKIQPRRHGDQFHSVYHYLFRKTTPTGKGNHAITNLHALDAFTNLFDNTCNLAPRRKWRFRFKLVFPLNNQSIREVDPARLYGDDDLSLSGMKRLNLFDDQCLGHAIDFAQYGFHDGVPPLYSIFLHHHIMHITSGPNGKSLRILSTSVIRVGSRVTREWGKKKGIVL